MAKPMPDIMNDLGASVSSIANISGVDSALFTSMGLVPGVGPVNKFGHCSSATLAKTDVWELGDSIPTYIFPDESGENITIESSQGADTQLIEIQGLNENGIEVSVSVSLTGLTPVAVDGLFTAVNRAFNDSGTEIIGNVSIKGAVSGNTFAYISANEQQTTQCFYVTPSNKYIVLKNLSASINRSGNQDASSVVVMSVQLAGGVFRTQIRFGLQKRGTSNISADLIAPPFYPPSTKIKISLTPDTTDMDISAYFSGSLIDADLYDSLGA